MTIKRNRRGGEKNTRKHGLHMVHGKYCVPLCEGEAFLPEYVKRCIGVMESDPFATFELVKRVSRTHPARPGIREKPLVSVLIHNYNYGRYLRQCFESVVRQTYENIEVIFSDNCSSDDSWEIAVEYAHTYPGWMTLTRNRKNFGPAANLANCYRFAHGKYFCILCSDDALRPDFVSRCVQVLEANPESGFAMTHRTILDENGTSADEPSFYNRSCVIPGPEQAAVYMMAAVNPSISQIMYSREKAFNHLPEDGVVSRWYAQRLLDFKLCCHHSMAYIKEPLLLHRVHSASDSSQIAMNVMEAFGQFILPHQFAEIAAGKDKLEKAIARLPDALEKLGRLCLRYSTRALCAHDEVCSLRYFHLSAAVFPGVLRDPVYNELSGYWAGDAAQKERTVARLRATDNLMTRTVSYDPPPGSLPIPSDTHGTA
jgi:glycosyltransferase involved in cell wall biosynthesis